jgi:hypothetical protein
VPRMSDLPLRRAFRTSYDRAMHKCVCIVMSLVTAACTSSSEADKFVGHWTYGSASKVDITCSGQPTMSVPLGASTIDVASPSSGRIRVTASSGGCTFDYEVEGNEATPVAGQSCNSIPDGHGGMFTEVPDTNPALTTSDGVTLTDSSTGRLTDSQGGVTCTEGTTATLTH